MKLMDLIQRSPNPQPWAEGEKIPWNEPGFSQRMLKEHLSQAHDLASRRSETITKHVAWIHQVLLSGQPKRVLDLGCGPGLYTARLDKLGHDCTGIDFSPASIAYARQEALKEKLNCRYLESDLRSADFSSGYGLAMLIFGEFNTFRPSDARLILEKAFYALAPGGHLLLETSRPEMLRRMGQGEATWSSSSAGLFSAEPHLCLQDYHWDEASRTATIRYYVVDCQTGEVTRYAESHQAYEEDEFRALLEGIGFRIVEFYPSLSGEDDPKREFFAVVAQK